MRVDGKRFELKVVTVLVLSTQNGVQIVLQL